MNKKMKIFILNSIKKKKFKSTYSLFRAIFWILVLVMGENVIAGCIGFCKVKLNLSCFISAFVKRSFLVIKCYLTSFVLIDLLICCNFWTISLYWSVPIFIFRKILISKSSFPVVCNASHTTGKEDFEKSILRNIKNYCEIS